MEQACGHTMMFEKWPVIFFQCFWSTAEGEEDEVEGERQGGKDSSWARERQGQGGRGGREGGREREDRGSEGGRGRERGGGREREREDRDREGGRGRERQGGREREGLRQEE